MSAWHEIEDLQKKKAELEFQLHSLEEKEKALHEKLRLMEEKAAIQELEEHLKVKHNIVEQLESRLVELEKKCREQGKKIDNSVVTEDAEEEKTEFFFK